MIGTAPQSLGNGNFTVDPLAGNNNNPQALSSLPALTLETSNTLGNGGGNTAYAVLDFSYPAVCPGTIILTNGGLMNLHTDCTFGAMRIEGTHLSFGRHTYAELSADFTNFLQGGSGSITITGPCPPIINFAKMTAQSGNFSASFQTVNSLQYQVLCSTNLTLPLSSWIVLTDFHRQRFTMSFTDSVAAAEPARYYQIEVTQP